MNYQEFKPSERLGKLIDSYWFLSNINQYTKQRVLPDGFIDIIFNLGKSNSPIPKDTIVVSGMMTKFFNASLATDTELLGIRFKSGQLSILTNHPLFEIKNKIVDACEIIPELSHKKLGQLEEHKNIEKKLELIESVICKILSTKKSPTDSLITSVTDFILNSSELMHISKLAKNHYISLRQLERRFKNKVGVTVKEFTSIVRFNRTINSIANNPDRSLLHLAFDNGYYDHSHLTNEIKRFSGQIPSEFR